jgi:hypothetical protein
VLELTIGSSGICENFALVSVRPNQPKKVRSDLPLADEDANSNDEERSKGGDRRKALLTTCPKRDRNPKQQRAKNSYPN